MGAIRAVTFDLGDTLVDLGEGRTDYMERVTARMARVYDALAAPGKGPGHREETALALAQASEEFYHDALAEQRGVDIFDFLRWFLESRGLTADEDLVQAGGEAFCSGGGALTPLRVGAVETLAALATQGLRLGVISNTLQPGRCMNATLERRGLLGYFDACIYSSEVRLAKPHPGIFDAALRELGIPASDVVHVGDRLVADVSGAKQAGLRAVLIEVDHRSEPAAGDEPDGRIAELPELLQILKQWGV